MEQCSGGMVTFLDYILGIHINTCDIRIYLLLPEFATGLSPLQMMPLTLLMISVRTRKPTRTYKIELNVCREIFRHFFAFFGKEQKPNNCGFRFCRRFYIFIDK
jgi:hypothetical protein